MSFFSDGEILYKKGKHQMLLRCVDVGEAKRILEEVHEGTCGSHASRHMTAKQIIMVDITGQPRKMTISNMFRNVTNARYTWIKSMSRCHIYML